MNTYLDMVEQQVEETGRNVQWQHGNYSKDLGQTENREIQEEEWKLYVHHRSRLTCRERQ